MTHEFSHLKSGNVETTESFFSDKFLKSRIQNGKESNQGFDLLFAEGRSDEWAERNWEEIKENDLKYEEDVNQYITLTLADLANPQNLSLCNQYLVGLDSDAGQLAANLDQSSQKYLLYRLNADYLLLNLGLISQESNILGDAYFDKGGSYYFSAASNLKETRGGRSGLSDVLEKLSNKFGYYVEILRGMKNSCDNYFSFHFKFSSADTEQFENELTLEVQKRKI